ncbi:SDR family oxidoreductase [Kitasatospora sp. NPDC002040]|uniref:SDR family oxidoreductase n=1 Tax=Kitasatospora sp. NPDC002040 TaxID=3154661 RepID=UPI00332541B7
MTYPALAGRTAVVTGAASGIGAATARLLAAGGAAVALLARRTDRLEELAAKITAEGGTALAVAADITDQLSVDQAAATVHRVLGGVDLLVNAAGVALPNPAELGRSDEWTRMIDTNLTGTLRVIRAFGGDLVAAGGQDRAADLVNISSVSARTAFPAFAVYAATKAAVTHLSASLRTEYGPRGVRVSAMEPGLTDTEIVGHIDNAELAAYLGTAMRTGPVLSAEDVADLIGYTVSRPRHVNLSHTLVQPTRA